MEAIALSPLPYVLKKSHSKIHYGLHLGVKNFRDFICLSCRLIPMEL